MIMTTLLTGIANKIGINAFVLISICTAETGLKSVSNIADRNGGSFGICQISIRTARQFHPYIDALALHNPIVNAKIASEYIKSLSKNYNGNELIAAYNFGSVKYNNEGNLINNDYVAKVNKIMYNYTWRTQ